MKLSRDTQPTPEQFLVLCSCVVLSSGTRTRCQLPTRFAYEHQNFTTLLSCPRDPRSLLIPLSCISTLHGSIIVTQRRCISCGSLHRVVQSSVLGMHNLHWLLRPLPLSAEWFPAPAEGDEPSGRVASTKKQDRVHPASLRAAMARCLSLLRVSGSSGWDDP